MMLLRRKVCLQWVLCLAICSALYYTLFEGSGISIGKQIIGRIFTKKNSGDGKKNFKTNQLLILTYFRSGSSYIGDILQHNPGVFYLFEPLRNMEMTAHHNGGRLYYSNTGVTRNMTKINTEYMMLASMWFRCQFEYMDDSTLNDPRFMNQSISTSQYAKCIDTHKEQPKQLLRKMCLPMLRRACLKARSVHIKSIRLSMDSAKMLMNVLPNLKVLHLMRDPRGMLTSHLQRVQKYENDDMFAKGAYEYCRAMLHDVTISEELYERYPGRIARIFYEDVTRDPVRVARKMYKFGDIEFLSESIKYIGNMNSQPQEDCYICTFVTDSIATAMNWRKSLDMKYIKVVDENCSDLYDKLGYVKLDGNSIRNFTIPSRRNVYTPINILF